MEGSLYPNGVLVDQSALRRTETTKSAQILRNRTDLSSRGVLSGGAVTVNGSNSDRVDVAVFSGYTPRGDFIESSTVSYNVSLSDYTLGTINIVCAVYYENNSKSQPHETDGSTYPTHAEATYRLRVFTEAEFSALSASDDNLSNDSVDRCLLLAKVTAEGTGAALTTIVRSNEYDNILYTSPTQLGTLTGVTILSVDPNCPTGTGSITFDDTSLPTYAFQWTSPGGTISAATNVTVDSIITITDGSGYWIKIQIIISQLPLGLSVPYAETFSVLNLYYQDLPALTAEDNLHRNFTGTGIVTPVNPHGNSLDDFAGSSLTLLDEHQDVMHCNGIWRGSSTSIFLGSINTTTPSGDTLNIIQPTNADLYYVNGKRLQTASPTSAIFDASNFTSGYLGSTVKEGMKLYEIYVDDEEVIIPHLRAKGPESTTRNATGVFIVNMSQDHPAGTFDLQYEVTAGNDVEYKWDSGFAVVREKPSISSVFDQVIRLYRPNGLDWVEILFADDASTGDEWLKTTTGTYTDSVIVYESKDRSQNLQIISVPYWYDGGAPKGKIGVPPYGSGREVVDTRIFGNLCKSEMADLNLQEIIYHSQDEMHPSGILFARDSGSEFFMDNISGLAFDLTGGYYYCRGQRLNYSGSQITVSDNTTTLVYADMDGSIQKLDLDSSPFGGSDKIEKGIEYLTGFNYFRNLDYDTGFVDDNNKAPELGVPLWVVVSSAGVIDTTNTFNVCRNVNGNVDPWSVADFSEAEVAISAFNSLASAFAYGKAFQNQSSIGPNLEISLVGKSYIDFRITQPVNSKVFGQNKLAQVIHRATADLTGIWSFGLGGCVVDGVSCVSEVQDTSFFQSLASDTVKNCSLSSSGYVCYFISAFSGIVSNLKVLNNEIDSLGGILYGNTSTTGIEIRDNSIRRSTSVYSSSTYTANSAVIPIISGNNNIITGNTINVFGTVATGDRFRAILADTSNDLTIIDNYISLDSEISGSDIVRFEGNCFRLRMSDNAIYYATASSSADLDVISGASLLFPVISNNIVGMGSASSSNLSGLVATCTNGTIVGNNITVSGIGVTLGGTQNLISDCSINYCYLGCYVLGDSCTIDGCSFDIYTEHAFDLVSTPNVGAVGIYVDSSSSDNTIKNCDIILHENTSSTFPNGSAHIFADEVTDISIIGNHTSMILTGSFTPPSLTGTQYAAHVKLYKCEGNISVRDNTVDNVDTYVAASSSGTGIHGIYVTNAGDASLVGRIHVQGNTVHGSNSDAGATYEVYGNSTATGSADIYKCIFMGNYVTLQNYTPPDASTYLPYINTSDLNFTSTNLNIRDQYQGSVFNSVVTW